MPSSLAQNFRIGHSGATMKHQPIRHAPASEFEPRHVAILAYPGVALLDAVGPLEVFAAANLVLAERSPRGAKPDQVEIWSEHVGAIDGSCGVSLNATRSIATADKELSQRFPLRDLYDRGDPSKLETALSSGWHPWTAGGGYRVKAGRSASRIAAELGFA